MLGEEGVLGVRKRKRKKGEEYNKRWEDGRGIKRILGMMCFVVVGVFLDAACRGVDVPATLALRGAVRPRKARAWTLEVARTDTLGAALARAATLQTAAILFCLFRKTARGERDGESEFFFFFFRGQ